MYLKDIAAIRAKAKELEGLNSVEFYNQCHDEDGKFCEDDKPASGKSMFDDEDEDRNWNKALSRASENLQSGSKYWITRDGLFAPIKDYHSEVFPEGAGSSSGDALQAQYALFAKKKKAIRLDVNPRDASLEIWQPVTDDQYAAIAGHLQKHPAVYIQSHGRYGGKHSQVKYNPSYQELDKAIDIASRHASGEEISDVAQYLTAEELEDFQVNARMIG